MRAVLGFFSSHDEGLWPRASCMAVDGRALTQSKASITIRHVMGHSALFEKELI